LPFRHPPDCNQGKLHIRLPLFSRPSNLNTQTLPKIPIHGKPGIGYPRQPLISPPPRNPPGP
jgi:hypothetical protein